MSCFLKEMMDGDIMTYKLSYISQLVVCMHEIFLDLKIVSWSVLRCHPSP